jgi:enoyl-CoA hydratase/carnithine racemase
MSEKNFEHVLVDKNEEGNYAVISINRPDKLNALTTQTLREIYEAMEQFELDSSVRCVVLRGTKNITKKAAFSAGADLSSPMGKGLKPNIPVHWTLSMQQKHRYYDLIEQFPKPVVGAVDGYAFGGGCELTLVCDILIATKRSFFGFPEIARGIFPGNGGTQRMARRIGLNRALNMTFFGERISAEKMYTWGHVSYLCDDG